MKVILLADVKKLGKKDQIIEVSDGYAVNFLFPRHLAVQVTKKSVEVLENQQEQRRENEHRIFHIEQFQAKRIPIFVRLIRYMPSFCKLLGMSGIYPRKFLRNV